MTDEIDIPPRWDQSRAAWYIGSDGIYWAHKCGWYGERGVCVYCPKCGKRFPDIGKDGRQIIPARFSVTYQKY